MNLEIIQKLTAVIETISALQNADRSGNQYQYSEAVTAILKRIKEEVAKPAQQEPVPF